MTVGQEITQAVSSIDGIAMAFPATNADGSTNTQAQNTAVTSAVAAAIANGVIVPIGTLTATQMSAFVIAMIPVIDAYKTATNRPSL